MRVVRFDREQSIPLVDVKVVGPLCSVKTRLVFDTGSQYTIIDTPLIETVGYSATDGIMTASVQGATEERQSGYMLQVRELVLFGLRFADLMVGAFDFEHFARFGVRGVVGFDLIKRLHLEMDGPNGVLKVLGTN